MVTFLFTDVEGSTRRWESDADAMRVALAAHDKVLRSTIEAYEGFLFSHTGDGVAAAVRTPSPHCTEHSIYLPVTQQNALPLRILHL